MVVHFSLSEEGVTALREALTCLSKFSDEVSLEAKRDRVRVQRLVVPSPVHMLTTAVFSSPSRLSIRPSRLMRISRSLPAASSSNISMTVRARTGTSSSASYTTRYNAHISRAEPTMLTRNSGTAVSLPTTNRRSASRKREGHDY